MLENFEKFAVLMGFLVVLGLAFWRLSVILPKPEAGKVGERNFTSAHPPRLFNADFKCEAFYPFITYFISRPLAAFIYASLVYLGFESLPQLFATGAENLPIWLQVIAGLLILDLSLYIRHRLAHTCFWSFHSVHHCAREITWLTTRRLHPFDEIFMGLLDLVILYVVGFSTEGMAIAVFIKEINNMFVHSNIVLDYPKPLKYIFVSPNMHRWHHATTIHNVNYCIVFAFFDYWFGTYHVPDRRLPEQYGTATPEMDNIERKTILKELYYPFVMMWKGRAATEEKSA